MQGFLRTRRANLVGVWKGPRVKGQCGHWILARSECLGERSDWWKLAKSQWRRAPFCVAHKSQTNIFTLTKCIKFQAGAKVLNSIELLLSPALCMCPALRTLLSISALVKPSRAMFWLWPWRLPKWSKFRWGLLYSSHGRCFWRQCAYTDLVNLINGSLLA